MASVSNPSVVESLKARANALHQQGSYQAAYEKYSEAIQENPNNKILAILYANRAASCLALHEYLDAMHDGQKAVKLDPTYVKGWARIGKAAHILESWDICRNAWKSGLSCLPATSLTPAEVVLKAQFEAGLKVADAGENKESARSGKHTINLTEPIANMPWNRALALAQENKLVLGVCPSSGYVILNAYRDFVRGMTTMGQMVVKRNGDNMGADLVKATPTALVDITNGILRDHRVFHAGPHFFEQLETQSGAQFLMHDFPSLMSATKVLFEAELAEIEEVRVVPCASGTLCDCPGMDDEGLLDSNMGVLNGGVEFFKRILDVLEWGRRTYPNVPSEDRGVIFEASFVRGIRRLYIPAVLSLYLKNGDDSGYTLEDIAQMARDLKAETEASVRPRVRILTLDSMHRSGYILLRKHCRFLDGITCNSVSDTLIGRWISTQTLLVTL
ncbi:hypothetical protein B0H13DRAFT_2655447 [Mycena leptocephala]|nr:hypothetical protein B0H13DRAFT_2655447 [Mycena leptocephala]